MHAVIDEQRVIRNLLVVDGPAQLERRAVAALDGQVAGRLDVRDHACFVRPLGLLPILIDLYGVPKGTTGFFGAFYPLGLEWKASRLFYVIINPLGVAAPIPQLRDIPFWYPQYRLSIGLEVYAG